MLPTRLSLSTSAHELKILKSQLVISSEGHGGARYRPYAFTEHGAIMAATVLNSERAIEISVFVVLAFVRMRRAIAGTWEGSQRSCHAAPKKQVN